MPGYGILPSYGVLHPSLKLGQFRMQKQAFFGLGSLTSSVESPALKRGAARPHSVSTIARHFGSPGTPVGLRASIAWNGSCGGGALTRAE